MTRQEPNKRFKVVLEKVADTVKSGGSFSDALSQHPKIFDRLFVNMVKAGEAGGVLSLVLSRLAGFKEKALKDEKEGSISHGLSICCYWCCGINCNLIDDRCCA